MEARIVFQKPTGGQVEIFCLEPDSSYAHISAAMAETGRVNWICLIGGASKWKKEQVLKKQVGNIVLEARIIEKRKGDFAVAFSWTPVTLSFAAVLQQVGSMPLPPYLKRAVQSSDQNRYQTVYAQPTGSVAAPTAGLHFSDELLRGLSEKNMQSLFVTLHVGAGTFLPVKTDKLSGHQMHEEFIEVDAQSVQLLIDKLGGPIVAIGTTSLRTMESLYWIGLKIYLNKGLNENSSGADLNLDQWFAWQQPSVIPAKDSLNYVLEWIQSQPGKKLITKTQLFIVPGYVFKIVTALITNFHQPASTLLMLVAAFIGPEWKRLYAFALDRDYRFLSYGDGCLLLP